MSPGAFTMTWYGQAAFRLDAGGQSVLVDPFLSGRADRRYPPPATARDLLATTLVLCTHEHDDHLDLPFLRELVAAGYRGPVVLPEPLRKTAVAAGLPEELVRGAQPGQALELGAVTVHPVPAFHGIGGDQPVEYGFRPAGMPHGHWYLGYVIDIGGARVYHAGDTLLHDDIVASLRELRPDVLLVPVNGRDFMREATGCVGNLNQEEAAWLCSQLGPRYVVPMHYEGFANNLADVGRFVNLVDPSLGTAVLVPPRAAPVRIDLSPTNGPGSDGS